MAFTEFHVITAARKIIVQRGVTSAVRDVRFSAEDIRNNLTVALPDNEFNMWVEELVYKDYLHRKDDGDLTITELGVACGIALEDFPGFVEHFLVHNLDFAVRINAVHLKVDPPGVSQLIETNRAGLSGVLTSRKSDLLRRFFDSQVWYVHLEYAGTHDAFPVYDFGISSAGDCWLRVTDVDYVMRRIK